MDFINIQCLRIPNKETETCEHFLEIYVNKQDVQVQSIVLKNSRRDPRSFCFQNKNLDNLCTSA